MSLFKTGDELHDQYASYTTEQLIQIVTDNDGFYSGNKVETARRILLTRGHDYRTKEQKAAEHEVKAMNLARENAAATTPPRVRINRPRQPSSGSAGLKTWHWIWITLILVRVIGCLLKKGH
jgi:hypothetical protein